MGKHGVAAWTPVPPPPSGIQQRQLPPSDLMAPVTIDGDGRCARHEPQRVASHSGDDGEGWGQGGDLGGG